MSELDLKGAHERYMAALLGLRDEEDSEPKTDPMIKIPPQNSVDGAAPKLCANCGATDTYATIAAAGEAPPKLLCYGCFLEHTTKTWSEYCAGGFE